PRRRRTHTLLAHREAFAPPRASAGHLDPAADHHGHPRLDGVCPQRGEQPSQTRRLGAACLTVSDSDPGAATHVCDFPAANSTIIIKISKHPVFITDAEDYLNLI